MNQSQHPFFVIIDGIDGSGKTTIAKYIEEKTQAVVYRAMGQGPIGQEIRKRMVNEKANYPSFFQTILALASNLETLYDYVFKTLNYDKKSVVLDRFLSSTYAYQIYRSEPPMSDDIKKVYFDIVCSVLKRRAPTLFIYCDVDVQTALNRTVKRVEDLNHFDMEALVEKNKVKKGFEIFYDHYQASDKLILNCNVPLEDVLKQVDKIMEEFQLL